MAITNPDSLLDKNGLAYYHSKVMQEIDKMTTVTVNVTQSEHQTITYEVPSPYNWYTYTTDGEPSWGDLPSTGATFCPAVPVNLSISADSGFNHGTWVVTGDVLELERPEESYEQTNFEALVFLGETLNVSATPATLKPTKTVTLKRIQHPNLTLSSSELPSFTLDGNTYQFSQSQDVTFTVPEGTQVHLQANWVTNCYTSCSSSEVSIDNSPTTASKMDTYFTVNEDCEITCNVEHKTKAITFYTRKKNTGNYHIDGVSVTVSYTDPDTNESVSRTLDYGASSVGVSTSIPLGTTFNYSYTVPTGWEVDTTGGYSAATGTETMTTSLSASITVQYKVATQYTTTVYFVGDGNQPVDVNYTYVINGQSGSTSGHGTSVQITGYDGDTFSIAVGSLYNDPTATVTGALNNRPVTTPTYTLVLIIIEGFETQL